MNHLWINGSLDNIDKFSEYQLELYRDGDLINSTNLETQINNLAILWDSSGIFDTSKKVGLYDIYFAYRIPFGVNPNFNLLLNISFTPEEFSKNYANFAGISPETKISALRVVKELDAGDIYLKKVLNIEDGTASDIFKKASHIIYQMINEILTNDLRPTPQKGEVVKFIRRKPEEGNIEELKDVRKIYDYIRMLDAEGYPRAFLKKNTIKYEFYDPKLINGSLKAKVLIKKMEEASSNP